eukprot:m.25859 g.25859  ORF g.25859 m.25859 type:complete len:613 (-) comp8775_c1_seq1:853-2691(-)
MSKQGKKAGGQRKGRSPTQSQPTSGPLRSAVVASVVLVAIASIGFFYVYKSNGSHGATDSINESKPVPFKDHPQIEFNATDLMPPTAVDTLSKIIAPVTLETQLSKYMDRHPFIVRRTSHYFDSLTTSFEHVDHLLATHRAIKDKPELQHPSGSGTQASCLWVKDGMANRTQYPDAYHAYLNGCTIVCHLVPAYVKPISKLMDGFTAETGLAYMANMYLTPRNSQGFPEHTDNKDGLIIQVSGEKHWLIRDTTFPMPTRHQMVGRPFESPSSTVAGPIILDTTLTSGDVLFLARGLPHAANAQDSKPSLHYTISPTKNMEVFEFLQAFIDKAQPYIAARLESLLEASPSLSAMKKCVNTLTSQYLTRIDKYSQQPQYYALRQSLPYWYRAIQAPPTPGIKKQFLNSLGSYKSTATAFLQHVMQMPEESLESSDFLAGLAFFLADVVESANLTQAAVPIQCKKALTTAQSNNYALHLLHHVLLDREMLTTVTPAVLSDNDVFINYTLSLYKIGQQATPLGQVLKPSTVLTTKDTPASCQAEATPNSLQITATSHKTGQKQQVGVSLWPELIQEVQMMLSAQKHFNLESITHDDAFETAALAHVFIDLGCVRVL